MKQVLTLLLLTLIAAGAIGSLDKTKLTIFGVLPAQWDNTENPITKAKVDLGRMLYYEKRLSLSQKISCNSCHDLGTYGVDNKPLSDGHAGAKTGRNSPTVFNAAAHIAQFWDGRDLDVESQAKGPILAAGEMAMPSAEHVVAVLESIPGYTPLFREAFPESDTPISFDNVANAIGAFERKLSTPSRFDAYKAGKMDALNTEEKRGFHKFIENGCQSCHNGPALGGMMYQKLGLLKPWPNLTDKGRGAHTGNEYENYFFKVPSLRNIEKTSPYFHDGSVESLEEAVAMMAEYQLGKTLSDEDVSDIAAFLGALTGEVDTEFVREPSLPASGPNTPKPDLRPLETNH